MEPPTNELGDKIAEEAHHTHDKGIMLIALSSALIAVLAAVAGMLSEHQSNEAMLLQLKASDQWAYYQAKGIKHNVLETQITILEAQGVKDQTKLEAMKAGVEKYKKDQDEISKEATKDEEESARSLKNHLTLSYAETFLEVAIGISAISALTRKRWLWVASLVVALGGLGFLTQGVLRLFGTIS